MADEFHDRLDDRQVTFARIPFLSTAGMQAVLRRLLEVIPTTKLLFSSNTHQSPALYYLGAKKRTRSAGRCSSRGRS